MESKIDVESKGAATQEVSEQGVEAVDGGERRSLERKYLLRLDCMILPMISAFYFFAYLDRGNAAVSLAHITSTFGKLTRYLECETAWA